MSYKYNYSIQFDLDHLSQYEDVVELEKKKRELDHVYAQAAKADEYEAKAKAWDEALERWNDIENDTEEFIHIGNDPDLYYNDFRRVLNKYESGE